MGQALVRAKTVEKADLDIVFTLQLIAGCLIYTVFFLVSPLFARWYDNPVYADLLRVSALIFLLRPMLNLPNNLLVREMRFKEQAIASLSGLIASSCTSIALALRGYGVWSLTLGGLVGAVAQGVALHVQSGWRPGLSRDFRRGRELVRYGFLVSANDVVNYLKMRINLFLLSQSVGPGPLGLYNKGESLARMPHNFVTGSVYTVLLRAIAAEQGNLDRCRYLFARSVGTVAVYATPFYVGLVWLAEPLVRGLYGAKWAEAATPLLILAASWPFWLLGNLSGAVTAALNRLSNELKIQVVTLFVTALAVLGGLRFGIAGVAWAMVGTAAFICVFMLRLAAQALEARWIEFVRALRPALLLNAALALLLALLELALPAVVREHDMLHVAVVGGIGGLFYAACLLFWPIDELKAERTRLRQMLRLDPPARP